MGGVPSGYSQATQRLQATKANEYAIVYSLPQTTLKITLECEQTLRKPGEFYRYAKRYLNVEPEITTETRSARLVSATVHAEGIPDTKERYAVTFKNGTSPYMVLDGAGIPLAMNTDEVSAKEQPELPQARAAEPTPLETAAARQVISQEMLQSQSTAKRAELAAQAIFTIRQTRADLLSGQADQTPPDGLSLKLMLENLEAQEQALMAMFVGTTSTWTDVATFSYTPVESADDETARVHKVLARISALEGFVAADDLSGIPVYIDVKVLTRGEMPVNEKGMALVFPRNGIAYRIPGEIGVKITCEERTYYEGRVPTAQYGIVYGINPGLLTDRKAPIALQFDPTTGGILWQGPAK